MKNKLFVYTSILLFIALISKACNENQNETGTCLTISAKNINNKSLISGGQYQILNVNNQVVGTYTLTSGTMNITNLAIGKYVIEEISSPDNYDASQKRIEIILKYSCIEATFSYIDSKLKEIPEEQTLQFINYQGLINLGEYNAVRIGEYYWIDRNFTHTIKKGNGFENDVPITQNILNRYLERVRIDPQYYQLSNITNFEKYYGRYYSYPSIEYMNKYCFMADENGNKIEGWRLPFPADYRQLFAMSPFNTSHDATHTNLNERDVRFALSSMNGENPLAFNIYQGNNSPYKVYWFEKSTNIYGFNMMPGGARLNGNGRWCNGLGPNGGCYDDGLRGDIYHLFYTVYLSVQNTNNTLGYVGIHDYITSKEYESYHYLNVRWCRPLTDIELGYKLYINKDKTDIKKLGLKDSPPEGYTELPRGYTRGFYVQYILNDPNTKLTVSDIINYAKSVQDNYIYENRNNLNVIL